MEPEGAHLEPTKETEKPPSENVLFEPLKPDLGTTSVDCKEFSVPNAIPLSPQWLLSKSGDNKSPLADVESPQTSDVSSNHDSGQDFSSPNDMQGVLLDLSSAQRKDGGQGQVPSAEIESGSREYWREEEREILPLASNGSSNDTRRGQRRVENREPSENRRFQVLDRRVDQANRDGVYEARRERKWSSRWGPDDKELWREKRSESEKGDNQTDRRSSVISNKLDSNRDSEFSSSRDRVWRPHSISSHNNNNRGDAPPAAPLSLGTTTTLKTGRGAIIGHSAGFAIGRGRAFNSGCVSPSLIGAPTTEKWDVDKGFRYPRAKLLDIFRNCRTSVCLYSLPQGFMEAPPLTQKEVVEPLAFVAPDTEEEVALEKLWRDALSATHAASKADNTHINEESNRRSQGKFRGSSEEGSFSSSRKVGPSDLSASVENSAESSEQLSTRGVPPSRSDGDWRQSKISDMNEEKNSRRKEKNMELITEDANKDTSKEVPNDCEVEPVSVPENNIEVALIEEGHAGAEEDLVQKRDRLVLPENLSLYYIDPQGDIQGPFLGKDMMTWFDAGFFGIDLPVRAADAAKHERFVPLGDVVTYLKLDSEMPSCYQAIENQGKEPLSENVSSNEGGMTTSPSEVGVEQLHKSMMMMDSSDFHHSGKESLASKTDAAELELRMYESMETARLEQNRMDRQMMASFPFSESSDNSNAYEGNWSRSDMDELLQMRPDLTELSNRSMGNSGTSDIMFPLNPPHAAPNSRSPPPDSISGWSGGLMPPEWPPRELLPQNLSHGQGAAVDAFHFRRSNQQQQLEWQQLQQQLERTHLGNPIQRQAAPSQRDEMPSLEHFARMKQQQQKFSMHQAPFGVNPHIPLPPHHDPVMDRILRLHHQQQQQQQQQRQQQQQQQQFPSQIVFEHWLRQQQQRRTLDQLLQQSAFDEGSINPLLARKILEGSRMEPPIRHPSLPVHANLEQSFPLRQMQDVSAIWQREQEHGRLFGQGSIESRIPQTWEAAERGPFVSTRAPTPVELLQQQQERHEYLKHQTSLPSMHLMQGHLDRWLG